VPPRTPQLINIVTIFADNVPAHQNQTSTDIDVCIFVTLFPNPTKYKEYRKQLDRWEGSQKHNSYIT